MPRNESPVAKLSRGRGGGWLVESTRQDDTAYNAAASLQEARAVAKTVAFEQGHPSDLRWRADDRVHYLMMTSD